MMKIWEFFKDNLFALGALIGMVVTTVFTFGLSGSNKIALASFKNKKKSDQEKLKTLQDKLKRVKEFQEIHDNILAEAEKKEESNILTLTLPKNDRKFLTTFKRTLGILTMFPLVLLPT